MYGELQGHIRNNIHDMTEKMLIAGFEEDCEIYLFVLQCRVLAEKMKENYGDGINISGKI